MSNGVIDIIIKSWNAVEYTLATIRSIKEKTRHPHRITIVDNGSSTETLGKLECQKDIILIKHGQNLGPGEAARTGFGATSSKYFVLMDNDVLVTNDWLDRLLSDMGNEIGIVAPLRYSSRLKYPYSDQSSRDAWENIKNKNPRLSLIDQFYLFTKNSSIEQFEKDFIFANNPKTEVIMSPPGFVSTSLVLLNRGAIIKSGGINSSEFTGYGGEDVDMCWRLGEAGYKIIRSAKVYVHHFEHSSMDVNKLSVKRSLTESNMILFKKWGHKLDGWIKAIENSGNRDKVNDYPFIKLFSNIKNDRAAKFF